MMLEFITNEVIAILDQAKLEFLEKRYVLYLFSIPKNVASNIEDLITEAMHYELPCKIVDRCTDEVIWTNESHKGWELFWLAEALYLETI